MNNYSNLTIHLEEPNGEKYADPPDDSLMEMAVNGGYITPVEKQEFLMPLREIVPASAIC